MLCFWEHACYRNLSQRGNRYDFAKQCFCSIPIIVFGSFAASLLSSTNANPLWTWFGLLFPPYSSLFKFFKKIVVEPKCIPAFVISQNGRISLKEVYIQHVCIPITKRVVWSSQCYSITDSGSLWMNPTDVSEYWARHLVEISGEIQDSSFRYSSNTRDHPRSLGVLLVFWFSGWRTFVRNVKRKSSDCYMIAERSDHEGSWWDRVTIRSWM